MIRPVTFAGIEDIGRTPIPFFRLRDAVPLASRGNGRGKQAPLLPRPPIVSSADCAVTLPMCRASFIQRTVADERSVYSA